MPGTQRSHTFHTPPTCQPNHLHVSSTWPSRATTYYLYTFHMPFTGYLYAIHIFSSCHLLMLHWSSTHRLCAISMPPLTCHVPATHIHRLAIWCALHHPPNENQHQVRTPRTSAKPSPLATSFPLKMCSHPPHQLLTFAGAALPGDDLPADATGLHLLEGLHLEVVSLGGLQILWLWEERHNDQA